MTDTRTCKGCAKPVGDTSSHPVGEWRFCEACFTKLFATKTAASKTDDTPKVDTTEPKTDEPPTKIDLSSLAFESEQPIQKVCRICEKPSSSGEYISVAGLAVCPVCYDNMLPMTKPKPKVETPPAPPPEPLTIQPVGVRNLKCTGCQRRITARGAKVRDDQPYCPDCFVKLPTVP